MKLYLTQHGEAHSKEQEPSRPLTNKGVNDVEHIGEFLMRAGIQVNRIIHSGKLRAKQTAEHLGNYIAEDLKLETTGIINPNDSPETFAWQSGSWEDDTLIVGHLPFLARLVSHLINAKEEPLLVAFQPGSIVCLERIADERWVINWMIRPDLFD
ncbi:MAG: phosphohistidine phosphatase SixA [Gammaproteobacteria bacterium]|nr:phosphohistidine phosphatase SixA [Gammaproteobacteria bacterium]